MMKFKNVITALLAFCMIFSCTAGNMCSALESDGAQIHGVYSIISSPLMKTQGARVAFYGDNGSRYITTAYETDGMGEYSFALPKGTYTVEVSRDGYLKSVIKNVIVSNVDIELDHGKLLAGDLNGDGKIDAGDIIVSGRNFASLLPKFDFTSDGVFDLDDLGKIMENISMKEQTATHTNVSELLCDYREDPLGLDDANPYLSWKMNSEVRGQKQTGYRIVVSSTRENLENGIYDIWDKSAETDENGVYYDGAALTPRTEYFWTVFVSDKDGNIIAPGTIAKFETALFGDFGENNKWIAAGKREFTQTTSTIEANITLSTDAVGVNFCHNEEQNSFLMWQINVTSGTPKFRPHTCENNGYKLLGEILLTDLYPTPADIIGKPFTMRMEIVEGTVTTYIDGTKVHTYTDSKFVGKASGLELRVEGAEKGVINEWTIYDESGEALYSESALEMLPYTAPLFRKSFTLDSGKEVEKARLYATSAGSHETYINGKRTGDDYLAPGKSEFIGALYYQTYDVTELLEEGENTLAATVGMGWYNGGPIGASYGTNIGLKAKLIVTYTDGTEQVVDTDSTWLSNKNGPVTVNKFYIGQYIDSRKNIDGWNENGLDTSTWGSVKATEKIGGIKNNLIADNTKPIRAIRELKPIAVTNPEENVFVYEFPANISATVRITASAPEGTEIDLKYTEMLTAQGRADTKPFIVKEAIGNQNGEDKYIFSGDGEETFEFSLIYHGFQYMEIIGLPEAIPLENITALVLSTDSTRTGYIETSNPLLNKFYENVIRAQEGNFVGAITDCPTREKNNWTGDAQGFAYAATYNFNVHSIYRRFQEMTRMAQGDSGIIPEVVPLGGSKAPDTTKAPSGWSDTVILIPWQLYFQYGDESFLTDNYEAMKAWADYLIRTCSPYDYVRQVGWYGDNVAYDRTMVADAKMPEIGTAYSAYSVGIFGKIAGILGNTEDEAYYKAESEKFAAAWRKNFLEEDGFTCKTNTQTSYAMGIYYDLYENDELKQKAADKLAELIKEGDSSKNIPANSQTVGFIGYPILYYALSQNGNVDTAFTLLENTSYPSILYPVTQGATTTWEYYQKAASLNHFFPGCVASWLYTDLLGITHDYDANNTAYKHFVLQPTHGGSLTYAKGSYNSQNGIIKSEWALSDDGVFTYKCTVPANTTATLKLPVASENAIITEGGKDAIFSEGVTFVGYEDKRAVYEITSGAYEFVVR